MHHKDIFNIGAYSGTPSDLAKIVGISQPNMVIRIKKWLNGSYSAQKCMTIGSISRVKPAENGNAAWRALTERGKTHSII